MSETPQSRSSWSPELVVVLLIPIVTLLAGAAMIHVASSFGFTALGEPLPATVSAPATRDR